MIERIRTKKKKDIGKFYDNIYSSGGYYSDEKFNEKILDMIKPSNGKLLDIACGQGTLLAMAERTCETYGIDISNEAIKKAKKIATRTEFRVGTADKLPYRANFFDYVTCMGSLEHFPDIDKSLEEIRRVLKSGGKAVIHVPNSLYLIHRMLGVDTQGQINERLATEDEWENVIGKHLKIEKVYKYNTRWYLEWIPKKYCCHFTFVCSKV